MQHHFCLSNMWSGISLDPTPACILNVSDRTQFSLPEAIYNGIAKMPESSAEAA